MTALLDSDVIVDHLRGELAAREFLIRLAAESVPPAISVITVAEIEAGLREPERPAVESLFASLRILPVDESIARQAGRYRARYGKSHNVLLPEALIGATAGLHGLVLYSLSRKHYPMDDVAVVVPYGKGRRPHSAM